MSFPLGRPILAMVVIALVAGAAMALRPPPRVADLTVWVFADAHARRLRDRLPDGTPSLVEQAERALGRTVDVKLIAGRALDVRLLSAMNAGDGRNVPDLVQVEIGSVGKYFRPPVAAVGFAPLDDRLAASGWGDRLLPARLAPWTKDGRIFGVPDDVHPVALTYRKDLFDAAGVDLAGPMTWPQFQAKGLAFQRYWAGRGVRRAAVQLSSSSAENLIMMLQQGGVDVLGTGNQLRLNEPVVAQTLAFYARLVAGPDAIGADPSPGTGQFVRDLDRGDACSALTPDWSVNYLRTYGPGLSGKLAMTQLPTFGPSDHPTATWGGTMIGIPRAAKDPDASWRLMEFLFLSDAATRARLAISDTLPPVPQRWNDPAYARPDPLFAGQPVGRVYAELASQVPATTVTPFTAVAHGALAVVMNRAISAVRSGDDVDLERQCQSWLDDAAKDVQRRIAFGTFMN
ncbi:MAG TPA: extracellular solute-binding protein [Tepidisphaeraceae bacterium]|nr:extracellular solute-binding protein [Tepidisphaeraceae bacterium]